MILFIYWFSYILAAWWKNAIMETYRTTANDQHKSWQKKLKKYHSISISNPQKYKMIQKKNTNRQTIQIENTKSPIEYRNLSWPDATCR